MFAGQQPPLAEPPAEPVPEDVPQEEQSKAKATMAKLGELMDTLPVIIIMSLISFILALVSMIIVIQAFKKLDNATDDLGNTVANWKTLPVTRFAAVSIGASCPSGYEKYPRQDWPGAASGPCVCPGDADHQGIDYSSSLSACSTNQTAADCETDPGLNEVKLLVWKGENQICVQRGGAPALLANGDDRPTLKSATDDCPTGYIRCGIGAYADGAICQLDTHPCPITTASITTTSTVPAGSDFADLGGGMSLVFGRASPGKLPFVELTTAYLSHVCVGDLNGRHFATGDNTDDSRHTGSCTTVDSRFSNFDTTTENAYLTKNFNNDQFYCGASTAGIDVIPNIRLSDCRSSDSICTSNADLTRCVKLQRYATGTSEWGLMRRNEIEWTANCPTTRFDIAEHESPLEDARDLQRVLMIISIITFLVIAVIVPCTVIWNKVTGDAPCCPGEGKAEKRAIFFVKNTLNICAKIARIVPMIIILGFLGRLRDFFLKANQTQCSDPQTDGTMSFLAVELEDIHKSNTQALYLDIVLIVMTLLRILFQCYKLRKERKKTKAVVV